MKDEFLEIGIVGLGLMGASIVTSLLLSGHKIVGVAPLPDDLNHAFKRVEHYLEESYKQGFAKQKPQEYLQQLLLTEDFEDLKNCGLVMECVIENIEVKKIIYKKVESCISKTAILTTNTSAIPITILKD